MDEFVEQFLIESRELVEQGAAALDALEKGGSSEREIDGLFRAVHTLKGAAGIVDFDAMGRALHAVEGVLSGLRASGKSTPPNFVGDCYFCLDQVTRWLDEMQSTGEPPKNADAAADHIIRRFDPAVVVGKAAPLPQDQAWLRQLCAAHPAEAAASISAFRYRPKADAFFGGEDPLALVAIVPGLACLDLSLADDAGLEDFDPFHCNICIAALSSASMPDLLRIFKDVIDQAEIVALETAGITEQKLSHAATAMLEAQLQMLQIDAPDGLAGRIGSAGHVALNILRLAGLPDAVAAVEKAISDSSTTDSAEALIAAIESTLHGRALAPAIADAPQPAAQTTRSLRVDMDRIDALVDLTGELMVVKNAIGHLAGVTLTAVDAKAVALELRKQHDLFERLVQQLHRAVLEVRVLSLRHVFQRFPRLVREISSTLGKPVKFVMEGEATEADAAVVEGLFEPLLHVIRNAIGHGVEEPAGRAASGKSATATITLRARRQLENVVVEVEDDGRGIDINRVRQTAATRQVATADQLAAMSDAEAIALIFAPGFSTATEVTGLSGRGVGMDAVKTAVERIGGGVAVETRAGQGTIIRLNLPFSVMMTRVMTVAVAGQVFGLPLDAVVETAVVPRNAIFAIGAGRAVVLRERTLPLVDLSQELGLVKSGRSADEVRIVVIAAGGQFGAIEVDGVGVRMDVMLKPMEGLLQGISGLAGTTLMGDGRVLVVLDVQGLFL